MLFPEIAEFRVGSLYFVLLLAWSLFRDWFHESGAE